MVVVDGICIFLGPLINFVVWLRARSCTLKSTANDEHFF